MEYFHAKTIVHRTKNQAWFGCEYNMNIYRGCCHGCIYCDSRSECYHVGDFPTVKAKQDALKIIRDDLRRKIKPGVVATGSMSDPYNPFERELLLTRHALELIAAYGFGVAIATKSPLICRDADILAEIRPQAPVIAKITITAADDALAKKIEPCAAPSSERFAAIEALAKNGIFTGVLLMPVLPYITDTPENIRNIVRAAAQSGARFIYAAMGMTMRQGQREYFFGELDSGFPGLREKYQRRFGLDYECPSPRAAELWELFKRECADAGLLYRMSDIIAAYRSGYETQLRFF